MRDALCFGFFFLPCVPQKVRYFFQLSTSKLALASLQATSLRVASCSKQSAAIKIRVLQPSDSRHSFTSWSAIYYIFSASAAMAIVHTEKHNKQSSLGNLKPMYLLFQQVMRFHFSLLSTKEEVSLPSCRYGFLYWYNTKSRLSIDED